MAAGRRWRPSPVADGFSGYCLSGVRAAFDEACRRLEVRRIGSVKRGYVGRHVGAKVRGRDGMIAWLKVGGVYARDIRFFMGEPDAGKLVGVPKPALIANLEWTHDMVTWGARLMTFVADPIVERNPWAGTRAAQIGEAWIAKLRLALDELAQAETKRIACDPVTLRTVVEDRYGAVAPARREWYPAHCDLNWNNLTAPELVILDWESWGLAPPGYDVAMLLAYSANDAALVSRLERGFAGTLARRSVQATQLYVLDLLVNSSGKGWLDPQLHDPLARMLDAVRLGWRNRA